VLSSRADRVAMAAGAIIVATAFEKVDFTAPDKLAMEAAEADAGDLQAASVGQPTTLTTSEVTT
jgi:hypothetical protein